MRQAHTTGICDSRFPKTVCSGFVSPNSNRRDHRPRADDPVSSYDQCALLSTATGLAAIYTLYCRSPFEP